MKIIIDTDEGEVLEQVGELDAVLLGPYGPDSAQALAALAREAVLSEWKAMKKREADMLAKKEKREAGRCKDCLGTEAVERGRCVHCRTERALS